MEKRIVVPDEMLKAALVAEVSSAQTNTERMRIGLEAALRWLSENPIAPTERQLSDLNELYVRYGYGPNGFSNVCEEWQRHMFLAPDPEVLEVIKDLLQGDRFGDPTAPRITSNKAWDEAIIEAYKRGMAAQRGK